MDSKNPSRQAEGFLLREKFYMQSEGPSNEIKKIPVPR